MQLSHDYVLMAFSAYTLQNTLIGFLLVIFLGVTLHSLNIGIKSINIVKKMSNSKLLNVSYVSLVAGGLSISWTLIILALLSLDNTTLNFNKDTYVTATLTTFITYLFVSSHHYHLTNFVVEDKAPKETEMT